MDARRRKREMSSQTRLRCLISNSERYLFSPKRKDGRIKKYSK
jgi:hypothetical protein